MVEVQRANPSRHVRNYQDEICNAIRKILVDYSNLVLIESRAEFGSCDARFGIPKKVRFGRIKSDYVAQLLFGRYNSYYQVESKTCNFYWFNTMYVEPPNLRARIISLFEGVDEREYLLGLTRRTSNPSSNKCASCGANRDYAHSFCPYCGTRY